MTLSTSDIIELVGVFASMLGLAMYIRGQIGRVCISVETLRVQVIQLSERIGEVNQAAKASHKRLDVLEKDLVRVQVLQEQGRIN